MAMPMMPAMEDAAEIEAPEVEAEMDSPIVAALKQAQQAIDDAIVEATRKGREAPPVEVEIGGEEEAPIEGA